MLNYTALYSPLVQGSGWSKARCWHCRIPQQAFPQKAGPRPEVNNAARSQKRTGFLAAYKSLILSDISASLHCIEALLVPAGQPATLGAASPAAGTSAVSGYETPGLQRSQRGQLVLAGLVMNVTFLWLQRNNQLRTSGLVYILARPTRSWSLKSFYAVWPFRLCEGIGTCFSRAGVCMCDGQEAALVTHRLYKSQ